MKTFTVDIEATGKNGEVVSSKTTIQAQNENGAEEKYLTGIRHVNYWSIQVTDVREKKYE